MIAFKEAMPQGMSAFAKQIEQKKNVYQRILEYVTAGQSSIETE